ncbi:hypothetical protein EHP00_2227 [Ecytonucleospora hepatopenaei]|uniref:Uncharacterized protein n=1 Tax=Ecytonucleospora hepatopenaei TaxID=646526 RepID=A0A1W0E4E9_9MICR|nr:hypothetical protein EHP00_2227 [Ecytonucleospora hepatopenaei]
MLLIYFFNLLYTYSNISDYLYSPSIIHNLYITDIDLYSTSYNTLHYTINQLIKTRNIDPVFVITNFTKNTNCIIDLTGNLFDICDAFYKGMINKYSKNIKNSLRHMTNNKKQLNELIYAIIKSRRLPKKCIKEINEIYYNNTDNTDITDTTNVSDTDNIIVCNNCKKTNTYNNILNNNNTNNILNNNTNTNTKNSVVTYVHLCKIYHIISKKIKYTNDTTIKLKNTLYYVIKTLEEIDLNNKQLNKLYTKYMDIIHNDSIAYDYIIHKLYTNIFINIVKNKIGKCKNKYDIFIKRILYCNNTNTTSNTNTNTNTNNNSSCDSCNGNKEIMLLCFILESVLLVYPKNIEQERNIKELIFLYDHIKTRYKKIEETIKELP